MHYLKHTIKSLVCLKFRFNGLWFTWWVGKTKGTPILYAWSAECSTETSLHHCLVGPQPCLLQIQGKCYPQTFLMVFASWDNINRPSLSHRFCGLNSTDCKYHTFIQELDRPWRGRRQHGHEGDRILPPASSGTKLNVH